MADVKAMVGGGKSDGQLLDKEDQVALDTSVSDELQNQMEDQKEEKTQGIFGKLSKMLGIDNDTKISKQ